MKTLFYCMVLSCGAQAWAQFTVSTVAGGTIQSDVPAKNVPVTEWLAQDSTGTTHVCDGAYLIRRIGPDGVISTIAGTGISAYSGDGGQAINAALNLPSFCTVDRSGNLIFADQYNHRIRRVDGAGTISTIAGTGIPGALGGGGPAVAAQVDWIGGLAVDRSGNVYFSEETQNRIRRITQTGQIELIAGIPQPGGFPKSTGDGGAAILAGLNSPKGLAFDSAGNLYFIDDLQSRIRRIAK